MTRLDIFKDLTTISREMDAIFNGLGLGCRFEPALAAPRRAPQFKVRTEGDAYLLEAQLPGIDPAALEMSVHRGTLTLAGTRQTEAPEQAVWHRQERTCGPFKRTLELPEEIDLDRVRADYRNGVLTVTLPKLAAAQPKRIAINAA